MPGGKSQRWLPGVWSPNGQSASGTTVTTFEGSQAGKGLGKPHAAARSPESTTQPAPQLGEPSWSTSPRMGSGVRGSTGGELMKTFCRPVGALLKSWKMIPPPVLKRARSPAIWLPSA